MAKPAPTVSKQTYSTNKKKDSEQNQPKKDRVSHIAEKSSTHDMNLMNGIVDLKNVTIERLDKLDSSVNQLKNSVATKDDITDLKKFMMEQFLDYGDTVKRALSKKS